MPSRVIGNDSVISIHPVGTGSRRDLVLRGLRSARITGWYPDGRSVLVCGLGATGAQCFRSPADRAELQPVTPVYGHNPLAALSPDGRLIVAGGRAFSSASDSGIAVPAAAGSVSRWTPDGRAVLVRSGSYAFTVALAKLPPDSARIAATKRHLPAWRDSWSRQGPELFRATVNITHSAFMFADAKAALISCPGYPSMSFPLMINVRLLFDSAGAPVARDTAQFASYLFHETLHRYISDIIESRPDSTTPLLRKYAGEHPPVLAHLHLYALVDTVYRQLRRGDNVLRAFVRELQPTGPATVRTPP